MKKVFKESFSTEGYNETTISKLKEGVKGILKGTITLKAKKTAGDKPYIQLTLSDSTGKVSCNLWDESELNKFVELEKDNNQKVIIYGTLKLNGSYKNLDIHQMEIILPDDVESLLPSIDELKAELKKRYLMVRSPFLQDVMKHVMSLKDVNKLLFETPATEQTAYAYRGGVAHLIIDTVDAVLSMVDSFNGSPFNSSLALNEELLVASSFLANVGRLFTLEIDEAGNISKTKKGQLNDFSLVSRDIVHKEVIEVLLRTGEDNKPLYDGVDGIVEELLHVISSINIRPVSIPRSKNAIMLNIANQMVYNKGLFESLERGNVLGEEFVTPYEHGKVYHL